MEQPTQTQVVKEPKAQVPTVSFEPRQEGSALIIPVLENAPYERGASWAIIMGVSAVLLAGLFLFIEGWGAFTMVLALAAIAGAYAVAHFQKEGKNPIPMQMEQRGISLRGRVISYQEIDHFFLLEFDTYFSIHLALKKTNAMDVVFYVPKLPIISMIRDTLVSMKVKEDTTATESAVDYLFRTLKL